MRTIFKISLWAAGASLLAGLVLRRNMEQNQPQNKAVREAFDAWAAGTGGPFSLLADDAQWTIEGNSLAAGTYQSREEFMVSVLPAPFWPAPSPRLKVRPRCRDEPRQPSPNLSSPRQTERESRDSPAPRTPRVCLGAQSQAPRQTTPPQKFADAVPSRPTHPRSSPTTSTILSRQRRKSGALVKPPARPPQNPCSPVHP